MHKWSIFIFLFVSYFANAQSKLVTVSTPGTLSTYISSAEKTSITLLTISGNIDARDFVFLRDKMVHLSTLNLGNASIKAYTGKEGTYKNVDQAYTANSIPDYAFYDPSLYLYKSSLTSLVLPATLVSIGKQAFYFSWNLSGTITLPSSVTNIGDFAFYGCYSIDAFSTTKTNPRYSTSGGILYSKLADTILICPNAKTGILSLPASVKHIHESAFENCYNLSPFALPTGLISIGKYGFANCSGISGNLILPGTLKRIEDGAFYACYNLTGTVEIPASLTDIGYSCFLESNSINSFNINSSNTKYASNNGCFYSKNLDTLFICPPTKVGMFSIPNTVKLIGSHAFYNCSSLTGTMNIPSEVDYIGYYAFYGTNNISEYAVHPENPYFTAINSCLYSHDNNRLLAVPALKKGNISFEDNLKYIDPAAMNNCSQLTGELTFSSSLEWIGAYAFFNCSGISGFRIDASNNTFSSDEGVLFNKTMDTLWICPLSKNGTYTVPETVNYIGISAFDGCSSLSQVVLPNSLQQIDNYAFEYCTGLTSISLPPSIDSIGNGSFYNCTGLKTINASMIYPPIIDYYAFELVNKSTCALNIPKNTLSRYAEAPYWRDFTTINQYLVNTGTHNLQSQEYRILNNRLYLNTKPNSSIRIYSLQGNLLVNQRSQTENTSISMPYKGVFILEINGLAEKIIL